MLAVVVDDHDMGVTHIIRGDDHLNNAFRQLPVVRAMDAIEGGWPDPCLCAHVPLIHGPTGPRCPSATVRSGVEGYRDEDGVLPEALFNYLLRLGWGHGDREEISREEAIELFDLSGVGKGPARFDIKKLQNLNGHYIREADDAGWPASLPSASGPMPIGLLTVPCLCSKPVRSPSMNLLKVQDFLFAKRPLSDDRQGGGTSR